MKSARMATNAKRLTLKAIVILSLSIFGFTFFVGFAGAQVITNPQGLAVNVEVKGSDVREGDIISVTKEGYVKATQPYDSLIFGVVVSAPILSVKEKSDRTKPVVSSGEAYVLVSTSNGEIKEGDLITSSTTAGVGQKATSVGYTVGKALSEYKDSSKAGLIPVIVNIGYGGGSGGGGRGWRQSFFINRYCYQSRKFKIRFGSYCCNITFNQCYGCIYQANLIGNYCNWQKSVGSRNNYPWYGHCRLCHCNSGNCGCGCNYRYNKFRQVIWIPV